MKKYTLYIASLFLLVTMAACNNERFIDNIYVEPRAEFKIDEKDAYYAFESIHFMNLGAGQNFVVWPGDSSHIYGKTGNSGYACNADGGFSYAYQEPGEYTAVWIASSIKANGDITTDIDSMKINIIARDGGLTSFSITRMARLPEFGSTFFYESYGKFVTASRIVCPMPYELWANAIKRTVGVKFKLESTFARLVWDAPDGAVTLTSEATTKTFRFDRDGKLYPQTLRVRMSSGAEATYEVAALMIPEFTTFTINGVAGVQTRDLSGFNKFNLEITLPEGTDKTALVPEFIVMDNDINLIDAEKTISVSVDGAAQTSGTTAVNFTSPVTYTIKYSIPGSEGYTYTQETYYSITVK